MNTKQNKSTFSNPPERLVIRSDFPEVMNIYDTRGMLETLDQELYKQGTSLEHIGHITLVYPQKHPLGYPEHFNGAKYTTEEIKEVIEKKAPYVQWNIADEICETVDLGWPENQTGANALIAHQIYEIHRPSQKKPLPSIERPHQGKNFFVIIDTTIQQGTRVANLMSYIEHNGGSVLAVASTDAVYGTSLAQKATTSKKSSLSKQFDKAAKNTGRLPEMAEAFSNSAKENGFNWSPLHCLTLFEQSLKKNNNNVRNVFALTDGECERLIETVNGNDKTPESFLSLLKKLNPQFKATVTRSMAKPSPRAPTTP